MALRGIHWECGREFWRSLKGDEFGEMFTPAQLVALAGVASLERK